MALASIRSSLAQPICAPSPMRSAATWSSASTTSSTTLERLAVTVRANAQPCLDRRFLIEPPAPFRLDLTAWALRRQAHNAVDRWDASSTYARVMCLGGRPVPLSVSQHGGPDTPRLAVLLGGTSAD